jgi:Coenzyme PQQ synthesis protein D (PqqD)
MPTPTSGEAITGRTVVEIPAHVVYRSFPTETVALNLQTGLYHSLNPTGGRMLEVLGQYGRVHAAVAVLASEYDQPPETLSQDVRDYCAALLEHGLLVLGAAA